MKQRNRCLVGTILLLAMLIAFAVPALAVSNHVISLPSGQTWTSGNSITRSGNYSYAYARNHSVYPYSGTDQYELIQCRIVNSAGTRISEETYVTLSETAGSSTPVYLREGYLSYKTIVFQFRGNSTNAAYTVVSYYSS